MSNTLYENIISGVIGSIIATLILLLLQKAYLGSVGFPGLKKVFRSSKEFSRSGGVNFFSSRKTYLKYKDHGTQSDYINKCESSVIYVGFWLAHGINSGNVIHSLRRLLEDQKKITVVLLNPKSPLITYIATYLNIDQDEVVKRINYTIDKLKDLYFDLSPSAQSNLIVKLHEVPINASAFLLDFERGSGGRTLIDFKLYNYSRDESFGIEFGNQGRDLYDRVTHSYIEIEKKAVFYDIAKH